MHHKTDHKGIEDMLKVDLETGLNIRNKGVKERLELSKSVDLND